jgi:phosphoribosylformylglycinamidine synthase
VVKPFTGRRDDGPSDAAVLKPLDTPDSWKGLALGCGFNPAYGAIDPYDMAVSAIDEAVRNVVAVGADPAQIAILDNFCWGNPLLPDRMGGLVRACKGCYDGALHYGTPFISGKDSLNNEYTDRATGQQVSIPPSLLISALGVLPDVRHACTMDLKAPGDALYVLGETCRELGGSYYYRLRGWIGHDAPKLAASGPATARALHQAIASELVRACHDLSEGGLAVSIAEMALAGELGAELALSAMPAAGSASADEWLLFSESNGRYLVEVAPDKTTAFEAAMVGTPFARVGKITSAPTLRISGLAGQAILALTVASLRQAWRGHLDNQEVVR